MRINIPHPKPSQFVSNETVEQISTEYSRAFREKCPIQEGELLNIDRLVDFLEIPMLEEEEDEQTLAVAESEPGQEPIIIVNKRYRNFFRERPDVYAAAVGHEIGHIALGHLDLLTPSSEQSSFQFDVASRPPIRLHKNTWGWYGLSKKEIEDLKKREHEAIAKVLKASNIDNNVVRALKERGSHMEPDWMFWQAECFARCLLIRADLLKVALQQDWNFHAWAGIYDLARMFGVSGTLMTTRLKKIGVIEIENGQPRPCTQHHQVSLFD